MKKLLEFEEDYAVKSTLYESITRRRSISLGRGWVKVLSFSMPTGFFLVVAKVPWV